MSKKFITFLLSAIGLVATASAVPPLTLQASSPSGEPFSMERMKGKVAVVFYWSTGCTVCRDSLPELRANVAGWKNKPFVLVTVNVDRSASDWAAYERILAQTQAGSQGLLSVRQSDGQPVPPKLPLTLLIDAKGNVVARYEGRLAPEVWDGVADLMP
jgi:thiol-disulfide isomerase/thioredoxin